MELEAPGTLGARDVVGWALGVGLPAPLAGALESIRIHTVIALCRLSATWREAAARRMAADIAGGFQQGAGHEPAWLEACRTAMYLAMLAARKAVLREARWRQVRAGCLAPTLEGPPVRNPPGRRPR